MPNTFSIADEVIFGREDQKVSIFFEKHKLFGFVTLLQCEKKTVVQYYAIL